MVVIGRWRLGNGKGRLLMAPTLCYPKDSFLELHAEASLGAGIGRKVLSQGRVLDHEI
jgi:hypothetical protein